MRTLLTTFVGLYFLSQMSSSAVAQSAPDVLFDFTLWKDTINSFDSKRGDGVDSSIIITGNARVCK